MLAAYRACAPCIGYVCLLHICDAMHQFNALHTVTQLSKKKMHFCCQILLDETWSMEWGLSWFWFLCESINFLQRYASKTIFAPSDLTYEHCHMGNLSKSLNIVWCPVSESTVGTAQTDVISVCALVRHINCRC